jgi:hypothetical protein
MQENSDTAVENLWNSRFTHFYSRERVASIYATANLEILREHLKFLKEMIDTGEKQAVAEWNTERENGLELATYAAMCLRLAEDELARRD